MVATTTNWFTPALIAIATQSLQGHGAKVKYKKDADSAFYAVVSFEMAFVRTGFSSLLLLIVTPGDRCIYLAQTRRQVG